MGVLMPIINVGFVILWNSKVSVETSSRAPVLPLALIEDYAEENGEANVQVEIPADQQEADDEAEADLAMEELIHGMASVMQASSNWFSILLSQFSIVMNGTWYYS
jgi:hypothetical protein